MSFARTETEQSAFAEDVSSRDMAPKGFDQTQQ